MSSRQIARLQSNKSNAKKKRLSEQVDDDEEEEDEEALIPAKKSVFSSVLLSSSSSSSASSSSSESDSEEKNDADEPKKVTGKEIVHETDNKLSFITRKGNKKHEELSKSQIGIDADLEYLNSLIASNDVSATSPNEPSPLAFQDRYNLCFEIDERNLDMDNILRKRFGRSFMQWEHLEQNPNAAPNRPPNTQTRRGGGNLKRRGIFCEKKDEWVKPPAFIDGGMAVEKLPGPAAASSRSPVPVSHFTLRWSKDYAALSQKFDRLVAGSGDANRLALFLWQRPYFVEGLIQFAGLHARLGRPDQAMDLTRRAIFCLECSFPEAFRSGILKGHCRLDPSASQANLTLCVALVKYMQLSSLRGCAVTAADLCRLLLGLCPKDHERLGLLLCLDSFLLQAGKVRLPHLLTGICGLREESGSIPGPAAESQLELEWMSIRWVDPYPVGLDVGDGSSPWPGGSAALTCLLRHPTQVRSTVQVLPNWSYSAALAARLEEGDGDSDGGDSERAKRGESRKTAFSTQLLLSALCLWPFVLEALLQAAGMDVNSMFGGAAVAEWKLTLTHPFFKGAMDRVPVGSYLRQVTAIFVLRSVSLWNTPSNLLWLHNTARQLLRYVDAAAGSSIHAEMVLRLSVDSLGPMVVHLCERQKELYATLSVHGPQQYASSDLEDFKEPTQFPAGVEVIDPMLDNPELLNGERGGMRLVLQDMGMGRLAAGHDILDVLLDTNNNQNTGDEDDFDDGDDEGWRWRNGHRAPVSRGQPLDLRRPLLQLFLLSLLPWITLT